MKITLMDKTPEAWYALGFGVPQAPHFSWKPCYLRFGHLPEGGKSFAYHVDAETGETGGYYEPGIGVFKAWKTPVGSYIADLEMKVHLAMVYVRTRPRPAYLVEGPVVGAGAAS
jgi:hypothetical protein